MATVRLDSRRQEPQRRARSPVWMRTSEAVAASAETTPDPDTAVVASLPLREQFQWFLTALSVRPGRRRAMAAQRLSSRVWVRTMAASSSGVKGQRFGEDEQGGPRMRMTHAPMKTSEARGPGTSDASCGNEGRG